MTRGARRSSAAARARLHRQGRRARPGAWHDEDAGRDRREERQRGGADRLLVEPRVRADRCAGLPPVRAERGPSPGQPQEATITLMPGGGRDGACLRPGDDGSLEPALTLDANSGAPIAVTGEWFRLRGHERRLHPHQPARRGQLARALPASIPTPWACCSPGGEIAARRAGAAVIVRPPTRWIPSETKQVGPEGRVRRVPRPPGVPHGALPQEHHAARGRRRSASATSTTWRSSRSRRRRRSRRSTCTTPTRDAASATRSRDGLPGRLRATWWRCSVRATCSTAMRSSAWSPTRRSRWATSARSCEPPMARSASRRWSSRAATPTSSRSTPPAAATAAGRCSTRSVA